MPPTRKRSRWLKLTDNVTGQVYRVQWDFDRNPTVEEGEALLRNARKPTTIAIKGGEGKTITPSGSLEAQIRAQAPAEFRQTMPRPTEIDTATGRRMSPAAPALPPSIALPKQARREKTAVPLAQKYQAYRDRVGTNAIDPQDFADAQTLGLTGVRIGKGGVLPMREAMQTLAEFGFTPQEFASLAGKPGLTPETYSVTAGRTVAAPDARAAATGSLGALAQRPLQQQAAQMVSGGANKVYETVGRMADIGQTGQMVYEAMLDQGRSEKEAIEARNAVFQGLGEFAASIPAAGAGFGGRARRVLEVADAADLALQGAQVAGVVADPNASFGQQAFAVGTLGLAGLGSVAGAAGKVESPTSIVPIRTFKSTIDALREGRVAKADVKDARKIASRPVEFQGVDSDAYMSARTAFRDALRSAAPKQVTDAQIDDAVALHDVFVRTQVTRGNKKVDPIRYWSELKWESGTPVVPKAEAAPVEKAPPAKENLAPGGLGTRYDAENRPFTTEVMDPNRLGVYEGMQFRSTSDELNATSGRMDGVQVWDPIAAKTLTVWETTDGNRWVINGHHRRERAIALGAPEVLVNVFREADGVDFDEARMMGIFENIKDGNFRPIEIAVALRDAGVTIPDLAKTGVNIRLQAVQDGVQLSKLPDEALRFVAEGRVSDEVAAGIAMSGAKGDALDTAFKEAATKIGQDRINTRAKGQALGESAAAEQVRIEGIRSQPVLEGMNDLESATAVPHVPRALLGDAFLRKVRKTRLGFARALSSTSAGSTVIDEAAQLDEAAKMAQVTQFYRTLPETNAVLDEGARTLARKGEYGAKEIDELAEQAFETARRELQDRTETLTEGNRVGSGAGGGDPEGLARAVSQPESLWQQAGLDLGVDLSPKAADNAFGLSGAALKRENERILMNIARDLESKGLSGEQIVQDLARTFDLTMAEAKQLATVAGVKFDPKALANTDPITGGLFGPEQASLFARGETSIKGEYRISKREIALFEGADYSTVIHESMHHWRRLLPERDAQAMLDWALEPGRKWAALEGDDVVLAEERIARAFERYMAEGRAPTGKLKDIFARAKKWLKAVYGALKGSDIDVNLSDDVRDAFDRMLATDAEIAARGPRPNYRGGKPSGVSTAKPAGDTGKAYEKAGPVDRSIPKSKMVEPDAVPDDAEVSRLLDELEAEGVDTLYQAEKDLVARHNTTRRGLRAMLDLGGTPNPSIAVSRVGMDFNSFGDVTLIGHKDMIDPDVDYRNKMFDSDAYTDRQPRPAYKVNENGLKARLRELTNDESNTIYEVRRYTKLEAGNKDRFLDHIRANEEQLKAAYMRDALGKPYAGWESWSKLSYAEKYDGFESWLDSQFSQFFSSPSVKVGREWVRYSLDNVSAAMSAKRGAEKTLTKGLALQRAKNAKEITVEQARQRKDALVPRERMQALKDTQSEAFNSAVDAVYDARPEYMSSWDVLDTLSEAVGKIARRKAPTRQQALSELSRAGFRTSVIDDDAADKVLNVARMLQRQETEYFEAKPARPVRIEEFAAAIVPASTPRAIIDELRARGLAVETYDLPDERTAKVASAAKTQDVLFQRSGTPDAKRARVLAALEAAARAARASGQDVTEALIARFGDRVRPHVQAVVDRIDGEAGDLLRNRDFAKVAESLGMKVPEGGYRSWDDAVAAGQTLSVQRDVLADLKENAAKSAGISDIERAAAAKEMKDLRETMVALENDMKLAAARQDKILERDLADKHRAAFDRLQALLTTTIELGSQNGRNLAAHRIALDSLDWVENIDVLKERVLRRAKAIKGKELTAPEVKRISERAESVNRVARKEREVLRSGAARARKVLEAEGFTGKVSLKDIMGCRL